MKALTIYQPWASLIMIGAKPFEFRAWDYRARYHIEGLRIVIHASARPVRISEVMDVIERIGDGDSGLNAALAMPVLERLVAAYKCQGVLELSAGLGTAVIGAPQPVTEIFSGTIDSDRLDHAMFGWPLTELIYFPTPVPCRGAQGFWNWPYPERLAA